MQNQIIGFFILTTVALGILAAVEWNSSRHWRAEVQQLKQELDVMNVGLIGQKAKTEALQEENRQLDKSLAQSKQTVSDLRSATNELVLELQALREDRLAEEDSASFGRPEEAIGAWYLDHQQRLFERLYRPFLEKRELQPEQALQVQKALLAWHRQNILAASRFLITGPGTPAPTSSGKAPLEEARVHLRELLGAEGFEEFEAYLQALPDRLWLQRLQAELDAAGHPLNEDQIQQLLRVRTDARQHLPPLPDHPADEAAVEQALSLQRETLRKRLLSEARNFLQPEQVEILERH